MLSTSKKWGEKSPNFQDAVSELRKGTIRIKEKNNLDCRNHINQTQHDTYFVRLLLAQSH